MSLQGAEGDAALSSLTLHKRHTAQACSACCIKQAQPLDGGKGVGSGDGGANCEEDFGERMAFAAFALGIVDGVNVLGMQVGEVVGI